MYKYCGNSIAQSGGSPLYDVKKSIFAPSSGEVKILIFLHPLPQSTLPQNWNDESPKLVSAKEQVEFLSGNVGFSITEISAMLLVTRPTVYEWLDGKDPQASNMERLGRIYAIFSSCKDANLYRWWGKGYMRRPIRGKKNFFDLLCENDLNVALIEECLAEIKKAIDQGVEARKKNKELLRKHGFKELSGKELKEKIRIVSTQIGFRQD